MREDKVSEPSFENIRQYYDTYYKGLFAEGKLNCRDTGIGFWGCSSITLLHEFFAEIKLDRLRGFLDLGSGDGSAVLLASLFTKSHGIEYDNDLCQKSLDASATIFGNGNQAAPLSNPAKCNASFSTGDFMEFSFEGYEIIFINPDKPFTAALERKLIEEMQGVVVIYNSLFLPKRLEFGLRIWYDKIPISIYYSSLSRSSVDVFSRIRDELS